MARRGRPPHPDVLTPRQQEVLTLVREGLSNREIAERLEISPDGVKFHVQEIIGRLGVTSRREAAEWLERRTADQPAASMALGCRTGAGRWRTKRRIARAGIGELRLRRWQTFVRTRVGAPAPAVHELACSGAHAGAPAIHELRRTSGVRGGRALKRCRTHGARRAFDGRAA